MRHNWYKYAVHWVLQSPSFGKLSLLLVYFALFIAVFLLASAAGNSSTWSNYYNLLLWFNIVFSGVLALCVLALLFRLLWRLKQGKFGAKLTFKFTAAFAALGLIPGLLVYLVSLLFLHQSIESWFNVKVDSALNSGIELSRSAMDTLLQDLAQRTKNSAFTISTDNGDLESQLLQLATNYPSAAITVFDQNIKTVHHIKPSNNEDTAPNTPSSLASAQLKKNGYYQQIEAIHSQDNEIDNLYLRAIATMFTYNNQQPTTFKNKYYLQIIQPVPSKLLSWAQTVTQGLKDYETLALGRAGLRKIYGATLTLTMFIAVLAAIATGFVLADNMTAPLLRLARGTQAVAMGDFTPLPVKDSNDDLTVLTRSFNKMSSELGATRQALTRNNIFLEQILNTLSTGVIILDENHELISLNPAAKLILHLPDAVEPLTTTLPDAFLNMVQTHLTQHQYKKWQIQPELNLLKGQTSQTLLLRGSPLQLENNIGTLLVFEDISEILAAQRAQAWGDVARRLAHEIKNPLTPIQLSAERLAIKLQDKLSGTDADLLKRSTDTIVAQVTALKNMVDEFRHFARLPQAKLQMLDIHTVIQDTLALYPHAQGRHPRIVLDLQAIESHIMIDPEQLRQVLLNLINNGLDADEQHPTQVLIATSNTHSQFTLRIADSGPGFSEQALLKLFEPYHTTKAEGTGLGLAVVKRIVQDHNASITVHNNRAAPDYPGACVDIVFPLSNKRHSSV